jgi:CRISPR/Cas system-associated protein Csm6
LGDRRLDSTLVRGSLDDVEHILGSSAVEVTTVSDVDPLWVGILKVGDGLIRDIIEYNSL